MIILFFSLPGNQQLTDATKLLMNGSLWGSLKVQQFITQFSVIKKPFWGSLQTESTPCGPPIMRPWG